MTAPAPKSVLGKAQLLLAAFGGGAVQLRLTELSRRSGVPKASAYRLAQELVQWGFLDRVGNSYQLGLRFFLLGQRVPVAAILRQVSRPLLVDLFAATRGTVHLVVPDGEHVVYLEKIAGGANVQTPSEVGGRLPVTSTASGKLFLALRADFPRLDSATALRAQLAAVRRRGYACEIEETLVGYGSIAAPVAGHDGVVYAAVSVTLPVGQLTIARLAPQLRTTAEAIAQAVDRRLLRRP